MKPKSVAKQALKYGGAKIKFGTPPNFLHQNLDRFLAMTPPTYGQDNQERAYNVLDVLLTYSDAGIKEGKIECLKTDRRIIFAISKTDLIDLVKRKYPNSINWDKYIRPVLAHYLEWLGILKDNRTVTKGSSVWKFELNLWYDDTTRNLDRFREEWEKKVSDRDRKKTSRQSRSSRSNASIEFDWLQKCKELLTHEKHLTTNRLKLGATRNLDDVHVPLGLMERSERPNIERDSLPESDFVQTKQFAHEEFLTEVLGKWKVTSSKHIAIIGKPGEGKTTLLTKIGEWLLNQSSHSEQLVVAFVPLSAVSDRLEDYLRHEWLQKVCELENLDTTWKYFKSLQQQGHVWLLLDGLDEMSGKNRSRFRCILGAESKSDSYLSVESMGHD